MLIERGCTSFNENVVQCWENSRENIDYGLWVQVHHKCKCEWMAFFYGIFRWMLFEVLVLMFNGTLSGCFLVMHSFSNIFVSCSDSFTYFLNGFRIWCLKCFVHSIACLFDSPEMLFDVCVCVGERTKERWRERESCFQILYHSCTSFTLSHQTIRIPMLSK